MISATQMRPGMVIKFNNELYSTTTPDAGLRAQAGPPTRSQTASLFPVLGKFPGIGALDGIRLEPVRFAHPIRLLPEDRILDRPPDKVCPLPFGSGRDPINRFQRCIVELDEDLWHMDNLLL